MPTSFWTLLQRSRIELGFVLRIRGVPTLFASFDLPSVGWLDIAGETYGWHKCIDSTEIADAASEIDAFSGLPSQGELSLQMALTPTVLELLDYRKAAATRCTLTSDADAADTTLDVDDTTPFAASGELQIGRECVSYTGTTATSFTGVTRGLYGSKARRYVASLDSVTEFGLGGPFITAAPLTLAGRHCDLYLVTMRTVDGVRRAYGSSLESDEVATLHRGPLIAIAPDYASGAAAVVIASKVKLLDAEMMTRFPQAYLGHGLADHVQIDVDSCRIQFGVVKDGTVSWNRGNWNERLVRDTWSGGVWTGTPEDVPYGIHPAADVGRWIAFTIQTAIQAVGASVNVTGGFYPSDRTFRLRVASLSGPLQITLQMAMDCVLEELGFEDHSDADIVSDTLGAEKITEHTWTAQNGLPKARLTAHGARRLYYHGTPSIAFDEAPGFVDDAGNAIAGYALVAEEIVAFDDTDTDEVHPGQFVPYLQISQRGALGSNAAAYTLEQDDDDETIRQVLALPGCSHGRALLYAALSDGFGLGYDQGWRGAGAALDEDDLDVDSFERSQETRDVVVTEKTTLRDLASWLLPQTQTAIVDSLSGALQLVDLDPLTDDAVEDALDLELVDFASVPSYEAGEDRVVNVVRGVNLAYDPVTGKGQEQTIAQGTSGGTYGYQSAVEVDMRFAGPVDASMGALKSAFDRMVSKFGDRFASVNADLAKAHKAWTIEPLTSVLITHPSLPDGAGGRGMVDDLAMVWAISRVYQSSGGVRASITAVIHDLERSGGRCRWAPSGRSSAVSGSTITIDPDTYQAPDRVDAANFAAGMKIRISTPGTTSSVTKTIASVSGNDIVCTAAIGLAHPVLVEFIGWAAAEPDQRLYAYTGQGKIWS